MPKTVSVRGQTVHWIGSQFFVCMFLDYRDKSLNKFQNVSGFQLQKFRRFRVQIPVTKNFLGTFVLLRIPQQPNIASCSGFHKM